jgi:hypothetical protein
MPVILVIKLVDPKRIIGKKWRAVRRRKRHKRSLTKKDKNIYFLAQNTLAYYYNGSVVIVNSGANPTTSEFTTSIPAF